LKQESPPLVFVWTGSAASDETNVAAQAHATELVDTLPAGTSLIQLVEGSESAEFSKVGWDMLESKPRNASKILGRLSILCLLITLLARRH
jgi:hypothetical protein